MGTVEMNEEELAKLIIQYCKAGHISDEDKFKFVLDTIKEIQLAVKEN